MLISFDEGGVRLSSTRKEFAEETNSLGCFCLDPLLLLSGQLTEAVGRKLYGKCRDCEGLDVHRHLTAVVLLDTLENSHKVSENSYYLVILPRSNLAYSLNPSQHYRERPPGCHATTMASSHPPLKPRSLTSLPPTSP